jgi:hypothetical protein
MYQSFVFSAIGNASFDLDDLTAAAEHFSRDQALSRGSSKKDAVSRSLGNLGRVYARQGQFQKASFFRCNFDLL